MDLPGSETGWVEVSADRGVAGPRTGDWTAAAIAHAAVCLTVGLGPAGGIGLIIGPAVALAIYVVYRARSRFVALHALQSLAYQVAGSVSISLLSVLGASAVLTAWGLAGLSADATGSAELRVPALPLTLVVAGVVLSVLLSWVAYGVYAAYQVYQGRDFRYWLIGDWVAGRWKRDG
jgi:uncharacterized Tic20 family protein